MHGGNGYENNKRRYLAYPVSYLVLHQGYSATNEHIRLPDCMTQAIQTHQVRNTPGSIFAVVVKYTQSGSKFSQIATPEQSKLRNYQRR
jgi:hypothetical protein